MKPRRANIVDLSNASHVVLRNLQIRHAARSDTGSGVGVTRVSDTEAGLRKGLIIEDSAIYQNQRFAISLKRTKDAIVRNNLVVDASEIGSQYRNSLP